MAGAKDGEEVPPRELDDNWEATGILLTCIRTHLHCDDCFIDSLDLFELLLC